MSGIKIPKAQIYPKFSFANIKKQFQPRNMVSAIASEGFLPVIALEAFVEAGRTYQAYKRGGFDEARERITEEFSGAVFWLGGVTALNWLFEKVGQKLLKLPKHVVDIAHDESRAPLASYLAHEKKTGSKAGEITKKTMSKFKLTKVVASVLIANAFIGFVLPKINQAITRSYHKNNDKNQQNTNITLQDTFIKRPDMTTFMNGNENQNKNTQFTGRWDLLSIANLFETNRTCKLLAVDAGTASGRAYSARNNNERVEILFRDLSSIYFYMFCMGHLNSLLNRIENGWNNNITTRLDPSSSKFATEYMENYLNGGKVDIETFRKEFLGENKELSEDIKSLFGDKKIIELDKFKSELPKYVSADKLKEYEAIAEKMSELQPEMTFTLSGTKGGGAKYVDKRILTIGQVKDIFNGGHINNPEFLKEFYTNAFGNTKFMDKYKYVAQSKLDGMKADLINYVKSIIKDAEKTDAKEITIGLIKKASKKNFKLNTLNWGAGFAVSALFLSTLIPKMQYLITKLRTGEDSFPGTEEYRKAA